MEEKKQELLDRKKALEEELKEVKKELKTVCATDVKSLVKTFPYEERDKRFEYKFGTVKSLTIGGKEYAVETGGFNNSVYAETLLYCRGIFKGLGIVFGTVTRPKVKDLNLKQTKLLADMISDISKIYNEYWVKVRNGGES